MSSGGCKGQRSTKLAYYSKKDYVLLFVCVLNEKSSIAASSALLAYAGIEREMGWVLGLKGTPKAVECCSCIQSMWFGSCL